MPARLGGAGPPTGSKRQRRRQRAALEHIIAELAGEHAARAEQLIEHDRAAGLNSVPQAFGLVAAFWIARAMHLGMLCLLFWLVRLFGLGPLAMAGVGTVAALLLYEHSIISPRDLQRMNAAFFTLNGLISIAFFGFFAADVLLHK